MKKQKTGLKNVKTTLEKFVKENKFLVRPFLVLTIIYMVGILAIILAGVHYADDVARTNYGYAGWSGFSRYLSTVLSHGLHAGGYLSNVAPLPQIIAVMILAVAGVLMVVAISGKEIFKEKWTKWILRLIAVVPLALSPYMLECLSYQYDAPYMAISVLAVVVPLLFWKSKRWVYVVVSGLGILVACMTYQAAIQIYPMLVILMAMREWNERKQGKELAKFVGWSVLAFVVSVVVFEKVLMIPRDAYASNSLPEMGNFVGEFVQHLGQYFGLVVSDFRRLWLALIGAMAAVFVVAFAMRSRRNKILASAVGMVGLFVMAVMCFAMYAALDKPLYATRAMYPFGALIAMVGVYIVSFVSEGWKKVVAAAPMVVLAWCFVTFGFTYGNILKEQNEYRNNVVNMVIADLNKLMVTNKLGGAVQTSGNVGMTPVLLNMTDDGKILYRLMAPSFSEFVPWMAYQLSYQSGLGIYYMPDVDLTSEDLPLIKNTVLYDIYGDERGILVKFKGDKGPEVVF